MYMYDTYIDPRSSSATRAKGKTRCRCVFPATPIVRSVPSLSAHTGFAGAGRPLSRPVKAGLGGLIPSLLRSLGQRRPGQAAWLCLVSLNKGRGDPGGCVSISTRAYKGMAFQSHGIFNFDPAGRFLLFWH